MKMRVILFIFAIIFSSFFISSANCNLDVTLVNQDPYPAVPGDLVKVVFQVSGIDSTECGDLEFAIKEDFPFSLDPSSKNYYSLKAGTYTKDYSSYFLAPFKIRVAEDALDGENPIEFRYKSSKQYLNSYLSKTFNIEVNDVRADFEVFVKNYDSSTNTITFELLNIGKEDIEAVTVEVPDQEDVTVKGANRNIVGDLNSNEDTTADFELASTVDKIKLNIYYSDATGERRTSQEYVAFDPKYFLGRKTQESGSSIWIWIFWIIILSAVGYYFYRRHKKKKLASKK
jgi:hypothetical protein